MENFKTTPTLKKKKKFENSCKQTCPFLEMTIAMHIVYPLIIQVETMDV